VPVLRIRCSKISVLFTFSCTGGKMGATHPREIAIGQSGCYAVALSNGSLLNHATCPSQRGFPKGHLVQACS